MCDVSELKWNPNRGYCNAKNVVLQKYWNQNVIKLIKKIAERISFYNKSKRKVYKYKIVFWKSAELLQDQAQIDILSKVATANINFNGTQMMLYTTFAFTSKLNTENELNTYIRCISFWNRINMNSIDNKIKYFEFQCEYFNWPYFGGEWSVGFAVKIRINYLSQIIYDCLCSIMMNDDISKLIISYLPHQLINRKKEIKISRLESNNQDRLKHKYCLLLCKIDHHTYGTYKYKTKIYNKNVEWICKYFNIDENILGNLINIFYGMVFDNTFWVDLFLHNYTTQRISYEDSDRF